MPQRVTRLHSAVSGYGTTPTGTRCPGILSAGPPDPARAGIRGPAPRPRRHRGCAPAGASTPPTSSARSKAASWPSASAGSHTRSGSASSKDRRRPCPIRRRPWPEAAALARCSHHHVRPDRPPADHHRGGLQPRCPARRVPRHQDPPAGRPATRGAPRAGNPRPGRRLAAAGRTA